MKLATLVGALLFISPAMPIGDSEGFTFAAELFLPAAPWLPDPARTPGAINSAITQANIGSNICAGKKWSTKSIRPPEEYTTNLKRQQLASDPRYHSRNLKLYEEDHLISLEIGGHPTDPRNLWPEVWAGKCGAHVKDDLENKLHELVCAGKITLAEAQGEIATDWVRSYNLHVGRLSCQ